LIKFTISLPPITKKNSQRIVNRGNHPIILPSAKYEQYEQDAGWFINPLGIDYPVNVRCLYYMPTKRIVDLVNLQEATLDVLVKYGAISDDNSRIVVSMDGSRVLYDKENPRTEIYIERVRENECSKCGTISR
jgi:Holliday junction resolvase RusA-like endonuclease